MAIRLTAFNNRIWRNAIALLLLIVCCAMFVPVPQVTSVEKDRSAPYPCMNRPCGCASADECWKHCCCFNNRQKVAWAKANNVEVPDFVVAAADREIQGKSRSIAVCPKCVPNECMDAPANNTATTTAVNSKDGFRKSSKHIANAGKPVAPAPAPAPAPATDVYRTPKSEVSSEGPAHFCGIAVLECRGLSSLWQILSLTMLPNSIQIEERTAAIVQSTSLADELLPECTRLAPEPPPIIGVAGHCSA